MFGFGKHTERIITIDNEGKVIDVTDGKPTLPPPPKPSFSFASFFGKPYNDNGREFNPANDRWEYVTEGTGGTKQEIIEGYGDSMATDSGL
jgi:hypothetical protein